MRLKKRLKLMSARAEADAAFKSELKRRLLPKTAPVRRLGLFKPALATAAMVLVFCFLTGTYAYASDSVLPGHPLYGMRISIEKVESALASEGSDQQADVELKHLEKRVHEVALMEEKRLPIAEADVERVTTAVKDAIKVVPETTEKEEDCDKRIQHAEMMGFAHFQEAAAEDEGVKTALKKSVKDLGDVIHRLREERRSRYENIELRYEAELFGIDWKLENGQVIVDEDEDIDTIVKHIPPEAIQEVMATSVQLLDIEASDHEDSDIGRDRTDDVGYGTVTTTEAPPYDWFHAGDDEQQGWGGWDVNRFDDGMVQERIRNYFDRLRLQQ